MHNIGLYTEHPLDFTRRCLNALIPTFGITNAFVAPPAC